MPNQGRRVFNVPPSVAAVARQAQGIPQSGAIPVGDVLAGLAGGKLSVEAILRLLALLTGQGLAPTAGQEIGPVEAAFAEGETPDVAAPPYA